jgi:acetoin utilization deacetylase AcuC-like enzyme
MKIVYTDDHRQQFAQGELYGGEFVTPFERPSRIEYILRELKNRKMADFVAPEPLDMRPVRKVHEKGFLKFLETAWSDWIKAGYRGEIIPTSFPARSLRQGRLLLPFDGNMHYRGYLGSCESLSGCGADGPEDRGEGSAFSLRAVPAAGPSRP